MKKFNRMIFVIVIMLSFSSCKPIAGLNEDRAINENEEQTGDDGTLRIWDSGSWEQLAALEGLSFFSIGLAWSPDGQQLTLVDGNGMVRILEIDSGEQLAVMDGHTENVYRVAWSPDGLQVALLADDGIIHILNVESGEQLAVLEGDTSWSVAWSPDGRQLATVESDGMVHFWDVESGEQLAVPEGLNDVTSVTWSPDGQKLATGGIWGNTACIWDAKSGEQLAALEESMIVVWSPDGQKLATSDNQTVGIWDAGSGEQLATLEGHSESVAWSLDGQKLATGGDDGMIGIWDTESGDQLAVLEGHTGWIMSVAWSPDGQQLATGSVDGTVRIWEIPGEIGAEPAVAHGEPLSAAEIERTAAEFEAIANVVEAYETGDVEAALANYTDDIVHNDSTFFVHLVGIDRVGSMVSSFMTQFSKIMQLHFAEMYIGSEDGITVVESWNFHVRAHKFTQDDPMVEVDLLETRDGRISYWTLFYDLDTLEAIKGGASTERLDEVRSLLASYSEAWSSGNPQMVASLYAGEAVREDSLFQERQEGPEAIMSFAESFFAWYPDAQWNLLLPFGEGHGTAPRTGGVYAINVSDPYGQTCEVQIAVLLNTSEDQIVQEALYYEPDSLISCGWAR